VANGKRNLILDAFYDDEWPLVPVLIPNPRGVQFNGFTAVVPGFPIEPLTKFASMPNPLNPAVTLNLSRPEVIPAAFQAESEHYSIFIPTTAYCEFSPKSIGHRERHTAFCVRTEFNRHGEVVPGLVEVVVAVPRSRPAVW
jgi:hypothetical protein